MDELQSIDIVALALPTPANLLGLIIFTVVGFAALRYGRERSRPYPQWIGVAMMVYPYLMTETWRMYAVGAALCAALNWFRE